MNVFAVFLLNFLNVHWWVWIFLMTFMGLKIPKTDEGRDTSLIISGLASIGGIWVFEKFIGGAKSFGLYDVTSAFVMTIVVVVIIGGFGLVSIDSEANKQEGKSESTTKQGSKKSRDPSYKGSYKSGKFHGTGTYTYPDGTTYKGEWKDGKYHGNGTQRSPNGRTLSGQWRDGEFLGESASKKVAKKSVSASNRSKRTSSDSGSNKLAKPKQKASPSSRKKRDAGVERVDFEEFMSRTMGGGPVYADMSIYEGKPFKCGCGSEHLFNEKQCGVLRELRGMHFVIGCPDKDYLNYVKITLLKLKTKFSTTVDPSQKLSSDSGSTESAKPIGEINRHATGNPSTPSSVSSSTREKLEELKSLLDDSLINEKDYEKKKNDLLSKM